TPRVNEPKSPCAIAPPRSFSAPGSMNTGLTLLISANTGIGSGRELAMSNRARPAACEPVKPTAAVAGCRTSAAPVSGPPCTNEKTPGGSPHSAAARVIAPATSSPVPGCAGCAFTTTGHPAANADAVSPPAVENASGKLLAPNTTTGPIGFSIRRISGRGAGVRSGNAVSIRASTHEPSRTVAAKSRSCAQVRPRSPTMRASGRPVSRVVRSISVSPSASISAAIVSRNRARASGGSRRYSAKASAAASTARITSAGCASWKTGSSGVPVAALWARNVTRPASPGCPAITLLPCRVMPCPGLLFAENVYECGSLDRIRQSPNGLDRDSNLVAVREREVVRRHDAGAGHEPRTVRKRILPIQVFREQRQRPFHLTDLGAAREDDLAPASDLHRDLRLAGRQLLGQHEAGSERGAPRIRLGLRQVERVLALDVARAHVVADR